MRYFKRLVLRSWRQFENVDLDLTSNVTIITGQNGSGKSSILRLLSSHLLVQWQSYFIATPIYKGNGLSHHSGLSDAIHGKKGSPDVSIGFIEYEHAESCEIQTKHIVDKSYSLEFLARNHVPGIFIPSHLPPIIPTQIQNTAAETKEINKHFSEYDNAMQNWIRQKGGISPLGLIKQSLYDFARSGPQTEHFMGNKSYRETFSTFQDKLRYILPASLGFIKLEVRESEIAFVTKSGEFSFDSMSGGVAVLFTLTWMIHLYCVEREGVTVLIDEPENHLHPAMQRELLSSLVKAFPQCRFIVATHCPFIVTSFQDASVYGLFYNDKSRVCSKLLERTQLASTPDRILRDVLGVPSNLPQWLERRIQDLLREKEGTNPSELAKELFEMLKSLGATDVIPDISVGE